MSELAKHQKKKVLVLGSALMILVFAGMAATVFISVNLIMQGLTEGAISQVLVGALIFLLWIIMATKTARARRRLRK